MNETQKQDAELFEAILGELFGLSANELTKMNFPPEAPQTMVADLTKLVEQDQEGPQKVTDRSSEKTPLVVIADRIICEQEVLIEEALAQLSEEEGKVHLLNEEVQELMGDVAGLQDELGSAIQLLDERTQEFIKLKDSGLADSYNVDLLQKELDRGLEIANCLVLERDNAMNAQVEKNAEIKRLENLVHEVNQKRETVEVEATRVMDRAVATLSEIAREQETHAQQLAQNKNLVTLLKRELEQKTQVTEQLEKVIAQLVSDRQVQDQKIQAQDVSNADRLKQLQDIFG